MRTCMTKKMGTPRPAPRPMTAAMMMVMVSSSRATCASSAAAEVTAASPRRRGTTEPGAREEGRRTALPARRAPALAGAGADARSAADWLAIAAIASTDSCRPRREK